MWVTARIQASKLKLARHAFYCRARSKIFMSLLLKWKKILLKNCDLQLLIVEYWTYNVVGPVLLPMLIFLHQYFQVSSYPQPATFIGFVNFGYYSPDLMFLKLLILYFGYKAIPLLFITYVSLLPYYFAFFFSIKLWVTPISARGSL